MKIVMSKMCNMLLISFDMNRKSSLQFRGPALLRGAMARGIAQNNSGTSYLVSLLEANKFESNDNTRLYVAKVDRKRIEAEEAYYKQDVDKRKRLCRTQLNTTKVQYKSANFD